MEQLSIIDGVLSVFAELMLPCRLLSLQRFFIQLWLFKDDNFQYVQRYTGLHR